MYQAIVFLPLLGFIIAGLISLAGARARFPGQDPAPGENHAADHGEHAAVHHAAAEPGAHDDHAPQEPAAAGSRFAEAVTTTLLFISMLLSWMAFVQVGFQHQEPRVQLLEFITSGDLKVLWALRVDTLTAVMLVVVT